MKKTQNTYTHTCVCARVRACRLYLASAVKFDIMRIL